MIRMSRYTPLNILFARISLYFLIIWGYFTILSGIVVIGFNITGVDLPGHSRDLLISTQLMIMTLGPILLATGILIDTLRTAYYHKGLKGVVSIMQFFGWIVIANFAMALFSKVSGSILPKYQLTSLNIFDSSLSRTIAIGWEPLIVGVIVAGGIISLGAQILKEVET